MCILDRIAVILVRPSCDRRSIAYNIDSLDWHTMSRMRLCSCIEDIGLTLWLQQRSGLYIYSWCESAEGKMVSKIVN